MNNIIVFICIFDLINYVSIYLIVILNLIHKDNKTTRNQYNNLSDLTMSGNNIETEIEYPIGLDPESQEGDVFKNIDDRINCKIAAGMKKAIHLIVDRFDDLF